MLLFSLGVVVSVELSVACNIHIGENGMGLVFLNFPANGWSNLEVV